MKLGVIGLGRMGSAIAYRALKGGHEVWGFDLNKQILQENKNYGINIIDNIIDLPKQVDVLWIMIPAGTMVDDVIDTLLPHLQNKILIDGGNSNYHDSVSRFKKLKTKGIDFLDCGVSGGIQGREVGFCLMIGGEKLVYDKLISLFSSIAMQEGFTYMGPSGAGHYVKMIHNGIEYALLQAYAEGFNLLKFGKYDLNLETISNVWLHGSIIRSWILQLVHEIFLKNQSIDNICGYIGGGQTGSWTLQEAKEQKVSITLIEKSLEIRKQSQKENCSDDYSAKLVALLRHEFGGHEIKKLDK